MLGKLLKHEWKEISVIPCVLSVVLLVLSVISGFSFLGIREGAADVSRFMTIMLWLLFYFSLIAVSIGITIYLAVHFYKTMYPDEGYLTHTLPVGGRELLWSKLIPMVVWSLLTMVVVALAVLIFGGMGMLFAGREGIVDIRVIWEDIHELIRQMQLMGGSSLTAFIISMVYAMIVGSFNGPMVLAASIAIGQLVGKHRILGSIGAYFGIMTVFQIASQAVFFLMMIGFEGDNPLPLLTGTYFGIGTISLVVTVLLFVFQEPLLYLVGASESTIGYAKDYLSIYLWG